MWWSSQTEQTDARGVWLPQESTLQCLLSHWIRVNPVNMDILTASAEARESSSMGPSVCNSTVEIEYEWIGARLHEQGFQ